MSSQSSASISKPTGKAPNLPVDMPCIHCIRSGKECLPHPSTKSTKCNNCQGTSNPCRVVEKPIGVSKTPDSAPPQKDTKVLKAHLQSLIKAMDIITDPTHKSILTMLAQQCVDAADDL